MQVLVGISLPAGQDAGKIQGIRVRYSVNGASHVIDFPYGLGITLKG